MSDISCPRLFEVEALRDGRLAGAERAHFERHLGTCTVCSREAAALSELTSALQASYPSRRDELHSRRERTRLLAAFDRTLVSAGESRLRRRTWLGLAFAALAAACVFALWRPRSIEHAEQPSNDVRVQASENTSWTRKLEKDHDHIALTRGTLWIHVNHGEARPPLLVLLPDGELEDTGTTFRVSVEDGHTRAVSVEEGSVVLRLRDRAPVRLSAGEAWSSPAPTAAEVASISNSPLKPPPAASESPIVQPTLRPNGPDAANDFREAVRALNSGQALDAAGRFARFLSQHPRDARAEDAAYLRVLSLAKVGDQAAMRAAANAYLRRYPAGFRRNEVEALARRE